MNSKRSYLDAVNAGRQRRSYASLEQLNRSLESLERRLDRNRDEAAPEAAPMEGEASSAVAEPASFQLPRTPAELMATEQGSHFDASYQSIARDLERVRRDSINVQAFGKIASEIQGLREELRHQMASSMSREFDAPRRDFRQTNQQDQRTPDSITGDIERLSKAVQALAERGIDQNDDQVRREFEHLKAALDVVAREETVRSVDRRFDALESRMATGDAPQSYAADLAALTERLEQINGAVGKLPGSLPIGNLEEKVRTLASALDTFIERQDGQTSQVFSHIEERLDEISRAIVSATMASQQMQMDPAPFERIEARISALAKQIEEVTEDRTAPGVVEHLQTLAKRIDALASQATMPDEAIARLASQLAVIADKIDRVPAMPDANEIFTGIEQRLDALSSLFDRRQDDALEQGVKLFRDLERRLNDVAQRIDQRPGAAPVDNDTIIQAIDQRLTAFAEKMENAPREPLAGEAIRALEERLENISRRLDQSASQFASIDPELVRNLEAQVSGLAQHLATPGAALPEFVDISPRLNEIERSISESRDTILEAARTAAENAARSFAASQPGSTLVSGFSDELKALEALARRSDERNSKTFEAIHDTLLKIVDRMATLEREATSQPTKPEAETALPDVVAAAPDPKIAIADAPSIQAEDIFEHSEQEAAEAGPLTETIVERTPAQAAAAAAQAAVGADKTEESAEKPASRSLFVSLTRALTKNLKKKPKETSKQREPELAGTSLPAISAEAAPEVDLDKPLDAKALNRPLEPGSGAPDLNAIMKRVRDERSPIVRHSETEAGKSDFIAAARRAAQAAAAEADVKRRKSDVGSPVKALRIGDILKTRRKHLLLGATALVTALAGLQLGKTLLSDNEQVATVKASPVSSASAPAAKTAAPSIQPVTEEAAKVGKPVHTVDSPERHDVDASLETGATTTDFEASATPPEAPMPQAAMQDAMADRFGELNAMPEEGVPMDGVKVASVTPAELTGAATESIATPVSVDVPADAGPAALREAASIGDAKAFYEIATRYAEGKGAKADMAKAAVWYEKAAESGLAPAQYRIGNMYEKGIGVERDLTLSRDWYLKAAEQGNASAMHNLAVLYAMGAAGQADNDAAAKWFIKAAEYGVKDSQFNLGILAAKGAGMKQSLEESYKWFALVAKTGDKDAASKRDEIGKVLRPEQLERARAATELWRPKALVADANTVDVPAAWRESVETAATIDVTKALKSVQQMLNKSGYDAGSADGVMGGKTRAAITQFQKDNGLAPTGKVDETLVRALMARG
ncbi:MAG: SEL1-like repeat protein [Rhizobiaceae bacterium]|nr:SEL1-like repeat protein [Rhizobiaceae bacterium]